MTDLWFTEIHEKDTKFCIKTTKHLHSEKSNFQQIDIYERFIYHDMITHTTMAVNPDIKRILIISGKKQMLFYSVHLLMVPQAFVLVRVLHLLLFARTLMA